MRTLSKPDHLFDFDQLNILFTVVALSDQMISIMPDQREWFLDTSGYIESFRVPESSRSPKTLYGACKGAYDQFMNKHLFVKIRQLIVANLANRLTKAGPMSEAIALGLSCDWCLDLAHFNFTSELLRINQRLLNGIN